MPYRSQPQAAYTDLHRKELENKAIDRLKKKANISPEAPGLLAKQFGTVGQYIDDMANTGEHVLSETHHVMEGVENTEKVLHGASKVAPGVSGRVGNALAPVISKVPAGVPNLLKGVGKAATPVSIGAMGLEGLGLVRHPERMDQYADKMENSNPLSRAVSGYIHQPTALATFGKNVAELGKVTAENIGADMKGMFADKNRTGQFNSIALNKPTGGTQTAGVSPTPQTGTTQPSPPTGGTQASAQPATPGVKAGSLLSKIAREYLHGGAADGRPDKDFNRVELAHGTAHEMEHVEKESHAREMAKETAKDHLLEHPDYYKTLEKVFPEEKVAGAYSGLPKRFFMNLKKTNPELHQKLSHRGGKVAGGIAKKKKESVEREARIQRAMRPPEKPQGEFGFMKESNENLKDLLTSHDVKDLKKYVLGKNELERPRELSPEEEERLKFRRRAGWSFFNPIYDMKKRDVFQQIQNPTYRAATDVLTGSALQSILPVAYAGWAGKQLNIPGKHTGMLMASLGAMSSLPEIINIKNKYKRQKLYNQITEEYIRNHQEGAIETMPTILRETLAKAKKVNALKDPKVRVKSAGEDPLQDTIERLKANGARRVGANSGPTQINIHPKILAALHVLKKGWPAIPAGFGLYNGITQNRREMAELNDIKERFERKRKEKEEADIFLHKARMPLYKEHKGTDRQIEELEHLFQKEGKDNSPLLPHQERIIEKLKQPNQPGLILMHGLGSGKTRSSIEAYKALGLPAEVVVPAALKENYEKELKKWVGKHPEDLNIRSQQMVGREGANPEDFDGKLMIVDEAHRMRNADTKLFNSLKKVSPAKRLLLTGTPIYNHPADIAKLINVASGHKILPEQQPEFEQEYISRKTVFPSFVHRLLGVSPGQELSVKNRDYLRAIFHKMIDYHGGSAAGFPEVRDETVRVPMDPDQQKVYRALMKDLPWHLRMKVRAGLPPNKKELDKLIPFLSGARMISNSSEGFTPEGKGRSPKIEQAARFLQERIKEDPTYKALVYSNYLGSGVNPYKRILDEARIPYGEFTGEINDKVRNQLVKDYNENRLKALLVSSAGGEGLDLKGTRLVQLLEPHFNNEKIKQVIGRAARYRSHEGLPEDKRNVLVQHYLSSLTPGMLDKLRGKTRTSTDEYLQNLSDQKERLNNEFIKLIKD
jgi:SNF2 family DNA or RNA helicase